LLVTGCALLVCALRDVEHLPSSPGPTTGSSHPLTWQLGLQYHVQCIGQKLVFGQIAAGAEELDDTRDGIVPGAHEPRRAAGVLRLATDRFELARFPDPGQDQGAQGEQAQHLGLDDGRVFQGQGCDAVGGGAQLGEDVGGCDPLFCAGLSRDRAGLVRHFLERRRHGGAAGRDAFTQAGRQRFHRRAGRVGWRRVS